MDQQVYTSSLISIENKFFPGAGRIFLTIQPIRISKQPETRSCFLSSRAQRDTGPHRIGTSRYIYPAIVIECTRIYDLSRIRTHTHPPRIIGVTTISVIIDETRVHPSNGWFTRLTIANSTVLISNSLRELISSRADWKKKNQKGEKIGGKKKIIIKWSSLRWIRVDR